MTPQETALIDELLKKPCWVVDFLPYQVPNGSLPPVAGRRKNEKRAATIK